MLEAFHEFAVGSDGFFAGIGSEPFAEGGVESGVLGLGDAASLLDELGVSAKRNVLHGYSVHQIVYPNRCTLHGLFC